jgi:toxin FitB
MYLLDTNVVSELRKPKPHGGVLQWLEGIDEVDIFLSAVTLGELQTGIELTRRQGRAKAQELEAWLDEVSTSYQILPADAAVFREWARLMLRKPDQLMEDALIAATARIHRLTIATRNTRDFSAFSVPLINPFVVGLKPKATSAE